MYFILFYLNLWLNIYFLNNFANIRGYPWIPTDMKKIGGYPHNGYSTDMGTGTGQIFIQRLRYGGATTCTLPTPLTSLATTCRSHTGIIPLWTTIYKTEWSSPIRTTIPIYHKTTNVIGHYPWRAIKWKQFVRAITRTLTLEFILPSGYNLEWPRV